MEDNQRKSNENKGRGLFYGVIAIAVFIIMAVGATFAYFTATTNSGISDVKAGSTTLQLKYISYGAAWMNNDMIPANTYVTEYSFERQSDVTINNETKANGLCKDDDGNSICSVYVFQVYNGAKSDQTVVIDLVSETNGFSNLYAMAYQLSEPTDGEDLTTYSATAVSDPKLRTGSEDGLTEEEIAELINVVDNYGNILNLGEDIPNNQYHPVYANRGGVVKTLLKYDDAGTKKPSIDRPVVPITEVNADTAASERTVRLATDLVIGGNSYNTYAIVLYIKNLASDQTVQDAGKQFTGQVIVGSGDGTTGVSGSISAVSNSDGTENTEVTDGLQSNG